MIESLSLRICSGIASLTSCSETLGFGAIWPSAVTVNGSFGTEFLALPSGVIFVFSSPASMVVDNGGRLGILAALRETGSAIARADFETFESDCARSGFWVSVGGMAVSPETRTNSLFSDADLARSTGRTFGGIAAGAAFSAGC